MPTISPSQLQLPSLVTTSMLAAQLRREPSPLAAAPARLPTTALVCVQPPASHRIAKRLDLDLASDGTSSQVPSVWGRDARQAAHRRTDE
ncbi:hypothetical protein TgHK011_002961 [Trichoderma gracile]|nr:hypothetical protein TgHK011_002961 [Trichoderma gracile]